MNATEAYAKANWLTRIMLPAMLRHDDGRQVFPEEAKAFASLPPIMETKSAYQAIDLIAKTASKISEGRDGALSVPLRVCFWGLMSANAIQGDKALPADYTKGAIEDLCSYLEIPCPPR